MKTLGMEKFQTPSTDPETNLVQILHVHNRLRLDGSRNARRTDMESSDVVLELWTLRHVKNGTAY